MYCVLSNKGLNTGNEQRHLTKKKKKYTVECRLRDKNEKIREKRKKNIPVCSTSKRNSVHVESSDFEKYTRQTFLRGFFFLPPTGKTQVYTVRRIFRFHSLYHD